VVRYHDGMTPAPPRSAAARAVVVWHDFWAALGQVWEGYKRTPPSC